MKPKPFCRQCKHCEQCGRTQGQCGRLGRKTFYCRHPDVYKHTRNTFVGYSDPDQFNQVLKLATRKKWCPIMAAQKEGP